MAVLCCPQCLAKRTVAPAKLRKGLFVCPSCSFPLKEENAESDEATALYEGKGAAPPNPVPDRKDAAPATTRAARPGARRSVAPLAKASASAKTIPPAGEPASAAPRPPEAANPAMASPAPAPARLVVVAGPDQGRSFALSTDGPLLIGRGRDAGAQLADQHVSRSHCQASLEKGRAVVKDLDSVTGLFVNDARVKSHILRPGDVIRIGATLLRLELGALADQPTVPLPPGSPVRVAPTRAPATATRPAPPPPARRPAAVVAAPTAPPLQVEELSGQALAHFRVGALLAPGRSGIVYRATDTREGKEVALKVFQAGFARDEEEMQRFLRAMKTTLPLRHPHLASILGAGRSGAHCWVSMELVEGVSLVPAMRHAAAGGGDWRVAFRALLHVSRALAYLHGHAVLHRNVTPANVLLRTADGVIKLGDLMTAKAQEGRLARDITKPGELVGDLGFLSPEQTSGAGEGDERADLYSLGAVAYALLAGRPPFEGRGPVDTILKIRQAVPLPPGRFAKDVPPALDATVMKLLAKKPVERYQTAGELLARLGELAAAGV